MADAHTSEWGSDIATGGFENEQEVAEKLRSWRTDSDAKEWLKIMGYGEGVIDEVHVENLPHAMKPDLKVSIDLNYGTEHELISIKKATSANYNQIDKRWADDYAEMWEMPYDVLVALKMYAGQNGWKPEEVANIISTETDDIKDDRRLYFDELPHVYAHALKSFIKRNSDVILEDILKGGQNGKPAARWVMVTRILEDGETEWALRSIKNAVNVLDGEFSTSTRGNIKIGQITLQRKGGDNGRETAQMLQFKMKPHDLIESDS